MAPKNGRPSNASHFQIRIFILTSVIICVFLSLRGAHAIPVEDPSSTTLTPDQLAAVAEAKLEAAATKCKFHGTQFSTRKNPYYPHGMCMEVTCNEDSHVTIKGCPELTDPRKKYFVDYGLAYPECCVIVCEGIGCEDEEEQTPDNQHASAGCCRNKATHKLEDSSCCKNTKDKSCCIQIEEDRDDLALNNGCCKMNASNALDGRAPCRKTGTFIVGGEYSGMAKLAIPKPLPT